MSNKDATNKKNWESVGELALAGVVVLIGVWVLIILVGWVGEWLKSTDSNVLVAAVTVSGTLFASVISVVFAQNAISKRAIADKHREQKTELYSGFIDTIVDVIKKSKLDKSTRPKSNSADPDMVSYLFDYQAKLILWGSGSIIDAYMRFKKYAAGIATQPGEMAMILLAVDDIFIAMRKDLGGSVKSIKRGDMIRLFLLTDDPSVKELLNGD